MEYFIDFSKSFKFDPLRLAPSTVVELGVLYLI